LTSTFLFHIFSIFFYVSYVFHSPTTLTRHDYPNSTLALYIQSCNALKIYFKKNKNKKTNKNKKKNHNIHVSSMNNLSIMKMLEHKFGFFFFLKYDCWNVQLQQNSFKNKFWRLIFFKCHKHCQVSQGLLILVWHF
jgi:hypothetical protein